MRRAAKAPPSTPPANHCFSLYVPDSMWWKISLAERLRKKTRRSSVSGLLTDLLDLALIDNGLMTKDGASLVKGIGPKAPPLKKRRIMKTPITLKGK